MKRSMVLFFSLCCIIMVTLPVRAAGPYVDNGDGTVTDERTGLMWQQADDGAGRTFENACAYCDVLESARYTDWRAPGWMN